MIHRFFQNPHDNFFLFGPRGTGKSTWLRAAFPKAYWIDLLDLDTYQKFNAHPEYLKEIVEAQPDKTIFILDEIQKVPELLSIVHLLIEKKKWRFVLTGSSSRKLKRSGVDLLAGRALLKTMHPFMAAELGKEFNLEKALQYGLLPLVYASPTPHDTLKTYLTLYIKEEVQMEGLVRQIGAFHRFIETASFSHGSLLNVTEIGRECHVERKVVENYLSILEDLLLACRVPIFTKRAKRATVPHDKLYYFDSGVFRSARPKGPFDRAEEIDGMALEGLVCQHLKAWMAYRNRDNQLYFWRTQKGVEIDFILYGEDGLWAIEVKNSNKVRPKDIKSLKSFRQDYPNCRSILVYRGKDRFVRDNIICVPCEEFLKALHPSNKDLIIIP